MRVTDFMAPGAQMPTLARIVDGVSGMVTMECRNFDLDMAGFGRGLSKRPTGLPPEQAPTALCSRVQSPCAVEIPR